MQTSNVNYPCSVISMNISSGTWRIPSHQRGKVWTVSDKNKLIDSILCSYPIGQLQAYEDSEGYFYMNDGQQRGDGITTFMMNLFRYTDPFGHRPDLKGKFYREFPVKDQLLIQNTMVNINVIPAEMLGEYDSDTDTYEFPRESYIRLNSTGCKMNEMEIFKAANDKLTQLVNRIVEDANPKKIIKRSNKRYGLNRVIETCICKAYMYNHYPEVSYATDSSYLQNVHKLVREGKITQDELDKIEEKTKAIFKVIGESYINKLEKNIGTTVLDGLFIVLSNNKFHKSIFENNCQKFSDLFDEYAEYCGKTYTGGSCSGSFLNKKESIQDRIDKVSKILEDFLPSLDKKRKFSKEDRELLWKTKEHKCEKCGETLNCIEEMDVDHIVPWSLGGKTILSNAQITCQHCNRSKGNKSEI